MTTRTSHKVVPSTSTPSSAGTPVGSEVQGPAPATAVPGAGAQVSVAPDLGVAAAFDAFTATLVSMVTTLGDHLQRPVAGATIATSSGSHVAVMPLVVNLLTHHPDLASNVQPAAIEAGVRTLAASRRLAQLLKDTARKVEDTGRVEFDASWVQAKAVVAVATVRAKREKDIADALAPVRAALVVGPRTDSTGRAAEAARQRTVKAQARVTRAQQHAETVRAASARILAAHAARHPGAGVTVTSPGTSPGTSPAVNPQGPSASVEAAAQGPAVNPQGPAPGR